MSRRFSDEGKTARFPERRFAESRITFDGIARFSN
jgi:hypothetical protein